MTVSGTGHSKCPGKSMGTEETPGNLPVPSTLPPVSHHLQLRAIASSGLPRKDKAETVSPLMWYFGQLHISVLSEGHGPVCHILAGDTLGMALVFNTKATLIARDIPTSPEGSEVLCNY